jgi:uroporphyrinogen decarboxylase
LKSPKPATIKAGDGVVSIKEQIMTGRERFLRCMNYQPVDRPPALVLEPYEVSVLERWWTEGLPRDKSPQEFLGLDQFQRVPVHFFPAPAFPIRTLHEDDQYIVQTDAMGTTVRRRKEAPWMYYGHIDHPVKCRADWLAYKQHFVPDLAGRLTDGFTVDTLHTLNQSDQPVFLSLYPFFFRLGFYTLGMERFLTGFHDEPELIHEMFSYWTEFVCTLLEPVLQRAKIDVVVFAEDLAFKTSTHISPHVYETFWLPYQDQIVAMLQKYNVPVIGLWTAGNINPILPQLLTHGVNCTWPLECQAVEMDPSLLRQRYGQTLRLGGAIAKEALIAGPEAIDREIDRLMPMMRSGGFIPALDDMVPPEVPFLHYRYLAERLLAIRL